jgi:ATP-dependent exoDNAse (exonuclease V) beta subunit
LPANEEVTFDWAGRMVRLAGVAVHAFLDRIATEGVAQWTAEKISAHRAAFSTLLSRLGLHGAELAKGVAIVETALQTALRDELGRWLLSDHPEAACEFAVETISSGSLRRMRIDRTFVLDGVRWIVDYKTGSHSGGGLDLFLDNEVLRYRDQMLAYASWFAAAERRPVRAGLYFPLLGAWREIAQPMAEAIHSPAAAAPPPG